MIIEYEYLQEVIPAQSPTIRIAVHTRAENDVNPPIEQNKK